MDRTEWMLALSMIAMVVTVLVSIFSENVPQSFGTAVLMTHSAALTCSVLSWRLEGGVR